MLLDSGAAGEHRAVTPESRGGYTGLHRPRPTVPPSLRRNQTNLYAVRQTDAVTLDNDIAPYFSKHISFTVIIRNFLQWEQNTKLCEQFC